jgi:hypothetical protein
LPATYGLVDWLRESLDGKEAPTSLEDYVIDVPINEPFLPSGCLKLIPAGRAPSPNYFQDLRRLRLDLRLDDGSAIDALIDLQERIRVELQADYLLIDARTGITSTNVVTTHVLADEIVALTLDTPEQLEGTRSVLRALEPMNSLRTSEPLRIHVILSRIALRPTNLRDVRVTDDERDQLSRVLSFLTEPAQPVRYTLAISEIDIVHTELEFLRGEFLSFAQDWSSGRSLFHADQWAVARRLFDGIEVLASAVMDAARGEPILLESLAQFFADPGRLLEARGIQGRQTDRSDVGQPGLEDQITALRTPVLVGHPGLEQQVAALRNQAPRDPSVLPLWVLA